MRLNIDPPLSGESDPLQRSQRLSLCQGSNRHGALPAARVLRTGQSRAEGNLDEKTVKVLCSSIMTG